MAPALNEPLSPTTTEKLTKSSVSVGTTVPVTRSTRRQSALGVSPTLKTATTPTEVGSNNNNTNNNNNNNNNNRDQKARRSNTPESPTTTTTTTTTISTRRKTRSNNKKQSTTTTTTESMVLNAALNSSNNNNDNNAQTSSTKENNQLEALNRDPTTSSTTTATTTTDTTQEILANLTINFEEAISAEICLRKQLLDSNLNKETSKKTNGTELKDILVIKGNNNSIEEAPEKEANQQQSQSQHMESVLETSAKSLEKILLQNINENVENVVNEAQVNQIVEKNVAEEEEAEEEVDTLEARLSQLDGSLCDTANIKATTIVEEHDLQDLHAQLQLSPVKDLQMQLKDDLKELQAQLELSPGKSSSTHVDLQDLQLSPAKTADMSGLNMLVDIQQQHHQEPQQQQQHSSQQQESTNIPQIVSNTGDIEEEDLEEVIRALKTFDPANAGPETLCDLNAIFGEVYQNMNYEDVNTSTQSAAITSSISISPIKSNPLQEAQLEIDKIQQAIQRKLEFLLRRLRKLQARHMCKHTSEELAGIFEYTVRTVNNSLSSSSLLGLESNDKKPVYMSVISARPAPEVWQKERETPVPTTQVYNLMRKIETAAKEQQLCTVSSSTANKNQLNPVRKSRKSSVVLDATQSSTPTEPTSACVTDSIVPTLDALAVEEISQVTGMLQAEMREVQQAIDSEATESSSGCESADEMISYNNHIQQPLPIEKRAAWRYARDRAAIAARWSWLMSHIADIDIKIRQHKELLNEIVRNKGPVIDDVTDLNEADEDRGACRTRGALSAQFRKRKLLQTPNIHTISKKAARPSTIKCGCQWPMQPCALCTGRSDPTAPRELPNTMVKNERVALLDSGFHPVLSLPEDVSSSIYSEAVARLSDWQQRAMRCQAKTIAKGVWKAEREATGGGSNSKKYDGNTVKRRYIKKKDRLAAEAAAAAAAANVSTSRNKDGETSAVAESGSMAEKNGTESATSTTPLVANRRTKQNCTMRKKITTTTTTAAVTAMEVDTHYQTISNEFPAQKYEAYNNNPTNQTLNSHKNNNRFHRNRKAFSSSSSSSSFSATATATATQNRQNTLNNPLLIKNNNNQHQTQPFHHINGNSSSSETAQHHHHHNNNNNNLHLHDNWDYETSMRSRTASPTHTQSSHYRSERKRSSYDIDNIVIPYSVAASTRVEIIPYKEIATPKWRIIGSDDECDEVAEDGEDKQHTVINEQDTTLKCEEDMKTTTTTEDLKLKGEEKVDEKIPEDNDSTLKVKEEEEKAQISTAAVKVEEQEESTESAKKSIETPIVNENESLAKKEEEEQEQVATVETQAEETHNVDNEADVRKLKTEVQENKEQARNFREKFDISLEDIKEDGQEEGEEETLEDITDTVMSMRHERGLIEERRKFQTYLKFPWTTRSRANRRGDSRAESSGANTPDPTSPAPTPSHLVGGDQESIPSPATTLALSAPTTPFTPVDSATPDALHEPFAAFDNRKHRNNNNNRKRCRTTSSKKDQERRSTSPDTREIILPYEPLKFPLSDAEFDDMQCLMPIEKPPEVKQESNNNNIRKPLGSYGRGRNGVRRQGHNSSTSLIRSLRPRLSNRPYVMDTKDMSDSMGLIDSFEQTIGESSGQQTLHLSGGNNYMAGDDNSEETEDETETCGLVGVASKDDVYTDDDDDDEDDDLDEDEYDGFPRNPLATADDKILAQAAKVAEASKAKSNSDVVDSAYAAYVGHSDMFSDCDSSDPEPFKDDDPNDPEWNGEPEPPRRSRL